MNLDRRAREYVVFTLTDIPVGGTLEVTFDDGAAWTAVTAVNGEVTILLAGPDATGNPAEAIALTSGRKTAKFRSTISPQVLIRTSSGAIDIG